VVIDLPRALVGWVEPVIHAADQLLLVTDVSVSSVRHCRRMAEFFTSNNVALAIDIVVNRQRRPLFRSSIQREAARVLGRPLDVWLPADSAAAAAADSGRPLSLAAPRSRLAKAYRRLAERIAQQATATQIQPAR
jgi:pilus assembly protein CpaE